MFDTIIEGERSKNVPASSTSSSWLFISSLVVLVLWGTSGIPENLVLSSPASVEWRPCRAAPRSCPKWRVFAACRFPTPVTARVPVGPMELAEFVVPSHLVWLKYTWLAHSEVTLRLISTFFFVLRLVTPLCFFECACGLCTWPTCCASVGRSVARVAGVFSFSCFVHSSLLFFDSLDSSARIFDASSVVELACGQRSSPVTASDSSPSENCNLRIFIFISSSGK